MCTQTAQTVNCQTEKGTAEVLAVSESLWFRGVLNILKHGCQMNSLEGPGVAIAVRFKVLWSH